MTKIKLCGLMRPEDIEAANELCPDYVGFVFASKSKRYVSAEEAKNLKAQLRPEIKAVGVFVNEKIETVLSAVTASIIDAAQLHGDEDADYIARLRERAARPLPIVQAFRVKTAEDIAKARESAADLVLLDAGSGAGISFDWSLAREMNRPYFLAGGLCAENVGAATRKLKPYGVDVSSGIETDGRKDKDKMAAFVYAIRKES